MLVEQAVALGRRCMLPTDDLSGYSSIKMSRVTGLMLTPLVGRS